MNIPIYQVDAFTENSFAGNPAAVCLLEKWPEDDLLQKIAAENNLAETAFLLKQNSGYELRWFTPEVEVDLCGHATLASAFVIFHFLTPGISYVEFRTQSGILTVQKKGDMLSMDFPSRPPVKVSGFPLLQTILGVAPLEVWKARDLVVVLKDEAAVRNVRPDFEAMKQLKEAFAVNITAPGESVDFVSRFFAPLEGIPEDPVTGSAHCTLVPYWANRLGKNRLHARQVSARGGDLFCELSGDRVIISGFASLYLKGEIYLERGN